MRVLIIALEDPWSPAGGAALRTKGWATTASQIPHVSALKVLSLLQIHSSQEESADDGTPAKIDHYNAGLKRGLTQRLRGRCLAATTGIPPHLLVAQSRDAARVVRHSVNEFRPDIVQCEQLAVAEMVRRLAPSFSGRPRILFSAHNLEHRIVRAQAHASRASMASFLDVRMRKRLETLEERLIPTVDAVAAVSSSELEWFQQRTEKPVILVPNAVELPSRQIRDPAKTSIPPTILFCGHLGYPPNQDATEVLVEQVFPRVLKTRPDVRLLLAGRAPGAKMRRLVANHSQRVRLDANPANDDFFHSADVLVCPLRHGAGSRLKLLQAAAANVPIVATPFAADGLELAADHDYLAGTTPEELAGATIRVLAEHDLRSRLTDTARRTVEQHHAWPGLAPTIETLYDSLC